MNTLVEKVLENVPADVFTDTTVRHLIKGTHERRYGLVKRALKSGEMVHIRRGLYALAKRFQRHPSNLYEIAQKISEIHDISLEEVSNVTTANAEKLFTLELPKR